MDGVPFSGSLVREDLEGEKEAVFSGFGLASLQQVALRMSSSIGLSSGLCYYKEMVKFKLYMLKENLIVLRKQSLSSE